MCGIAGVRRFGTTPIYGEELVLLLCALEHRGNHATGLALMNPDGLHILKQDKPAWQFTKSKEFIDFINEFLTEETMTALLHTRFYTVGSPEKNENNHPMFDGKIAVVHNGGISNHQFIFDSEKYERSCETDSDILRAVLSRYGLNEKGIQELTKLRGSAAIACLSVEEPDKLILARSGSPLVYALSNDADKMYWASEEQAILKASKPYMQVRGVWVQPVKPDISIGNMPDDTAWIFGRDGVEAHHKFNICQFYRQPDYSKGRETYFEKRNNWKKTVKHTVAAVEKEQLSSTFSENVLLHSVVHCPKCTQAIRNAQGKPWNQLFCPKCKTVLGGA